MSTFHCPMGAAFYKGEECLQCGLCIAKTKEQYYNASNILRQHLQSIARDRIKKNVIQKICICGKGGVGKSTIASLIAKSLRDYGYQVLVIDTDESNPGLSKKLGFSNEPTPLISLLGNAFAEYQEQNNNWLLKDVIRFEDIPANYFVEQNNIKFMMAGKISEPFQGCACTMSDIIRDLLIKMELDEGQIVLVDNEAGIESFGRGLERGADTILEIIEPSYDSIELAETIKYMAEGIGIRRVRAILNKIPTKMIEDGLINKICAKEIRYLGSIFYNPSIVISSIYNLYDADEQVVGSIDNIVRLMLDEAEMKYSERRVDKKCINTE